jgi:hypothetical protein
MIFCTKHRAILQTRIDSLAVKERELMQQKRSRSQSSSKRKLIYGLIGVLCLSVGTVGGLIAGLHYPEAIACHPRDWVCAVRHRGVVAVKK